MPRIPPISDADASEAVRLVFDGVARLAGRVPNFTRTVAHSPAIARWLLPALVTVQRAGDETVLEGSLRELAIVKTSLLNRCAYCTSHNRSLGIATGLTDEQLDALEGDAYLTSPLFTERERLAIAWAEKVTLNTARSETGLFERLEAEFTHQEIVELTMASAYFNMVNRINESLHVELEEQSEVDKIRRGVRIDTEALVDYVERALSFTAERHASRRPIAS